MTIIALTVHLLFSHATPAVAYRRSPQVIPVAQSAQDTSADRYRTITKQLQNEPSIKQLITIAVRQTTDHFDRLERWHRATRNSAVLPTLRVQTDVGLERDESLDRYQTKPDKWRGDTDRDVKLRVTAQWELSKLVYHPDELKIHRLRRTLETDSARIVSQLTAYYFERRQLLLLDALSPAQDPEEQIRRRIRIKALTAEIDALTDGALSSTLMSTRGD